MSKCHNNFLFLTIAIKFTIFFIQLIIKIENDNILLNKHRNA